MFRYKNKQHLPFLWDLHGHLSPELQWLLSSGPVCLVYLCSCQVFAPSWLSETKKSVQGCESNLYVSYADQARQVCQALDFSTCQSSAQQAVVRTILGEWCLLFLSLKSLK